MRCVVCSLLGLLCIRQEHTKEPHDQLIVLLITTGLLSTVLVVYEWFPSIEEGPYGMVLHYIGILMLGVLGFGWGRYYRRLQRWREEIMQLRRSSESASQAKTDFLANMSHEIRTPLNGVIGMLGLLSQMQLTEKQREYVDTIRKSSEQLLLVINDVLDIAKIEAGQLTLEPIPFDIAVTTNDVVETFMMECQRKNLELVVRHQPRIPLRVIGDPGRYRQILTNLIGNAVKFTQKGHIFVNLEVDDPGSANGKVRIQVEIEDTGIGIPADKQKGIFDRFSQADASTTRKFGGTGLGLAITRQLVRLMEGDIRVESEAGRGATFLFEIYLPVDPSVGAISKFRLPSPEVLKGLKVLLVDESSLNRKVLREIFEDQGMRVVDADSGAEAVEAMMINKDVNIVLVDNHLEDADGLLLGERAKSILPNVLMGVHTMIGQRGDVNKFAQVGFSFYLVKPFTPHELVEVISLAWARDLAGEDGEKEFPRGMITRHLLKELKEYGSQREVIPNADYGEVLVVEDDRVNQQVLTAILSKLGARPEIASNGFEGVEKVTTSSRYGLVLMDMNMPVMNGPDAARSIRNMERQKGRNPVPIVALTANALKEHRDACLDAGMNDYLTKPVTVEKLKQILEKWIKPTIGEKALEAEPMPEQTVAEAHDNDGIVPVDREFINTLTEGDVETQRRLFGLFFENADKALSILDDVALASEEWKKAAHKLKGSAGSLGIFVLSNTCARAEFAGLEDNKEEILDQINAQYKVVRDYCEKQKLI